MNPPASPADVEFAGCIVDDGGCMVTVVAMIESIGGVSVVIGLGLGALVKKLEVGKLENVGFVEIGGTVGTVEILGIAGAGGAAETAEAVGTVEIIGTFGAVGTVGMAGTVGSTGNVGSDGSNKDDSVAS
jgi:hypothetical protein